MEIMEHPLTNSTKPSSTDLLLSLPPELLLNIFSFIGVKNFRRDVRRLAVCKKWYAYARPTLLSSLYLRMERPTGRFPMLRALRGGATLTAAQQLTKHIELALKAGNRFPDPEHLPFSTVSDLEELASKFKNFAALRTLVIRPEGSEWACSYMPVRIFSSLATLHQLTSLELDLGNAVFDPSPTPHLCEFLSQLIPNLKRLRCRLPRICNGLLGSPPGDLEELIVSISPTNGGVHTRRCSRTIPHDLNYHNLRDSMETGLLQFAASMHRPKIVRLIHGIRRGGRKMYAFDAIQNRQIFLGTSTAWDADGVLLPEDWDESEENEESYEKFSEDEEFPDDERSDDEEFFEEELPEDEE